MRKSASARFIALAAMACILAYGAACGKKEDKSAASNLIAQKAMEKAIEKQSGGKAQVDLSKQQMKIKTKEGAEAAFSGGAAGVEIPKDFPKDVLVYKGAKAITTVKDKKNFMLMLESADAVKTVAAAYKSDAKKQGWNEETSVESEKNIMLSFKKKTEKRALMIGLNGEDGKTGITLNVAMEE
ncbi:MAG: hypothetical protein NTX50_22290 [Candidatus Sumerlaeota bacterium]|nr:hypothetical protein [Candidatus Sumerlaeota bacterium]